MGPCLRAVQAVHLALQASSGMVLGQTVNVKCPHAVSALMNQQKSLLSPPPVGKLVSNSHSPEYCYTACTSHEPILMYDVCNDWICVRGWRRNDSWLCYAYICSDKWHSRNLFVDGSAQVIEGNRRAGYAVTSTTEVVASGRLPDHFSAQAAELVALARACTLASGSVANIYTDSRYAFGVIHDFGVIWQTRKFLTSAGSPIKHAGLVKDLMFAMKIPKN